MTLDLIEAAEQAEECGNYEKALQIWHQLASEKRKAVYFCRWANAAQKLTRWDEAEKVFGNALAVDPKFSSAMEGLGLVFFHRTDGDRKRNLEQARDWYLNALLIVRYARTLSLLGAVYMKLGQLNDAKDAFAEAIDIDDTYSEAYFNLALLVQEENKEEAKILFEKAIALDSDELPPHQRLGVILQKEGDIEEAEKEFRRCLEIDPQDCWCRLYLANNLGVQGRNAEAEQEYRIAMSLCEDKKACIHFFANFLDSISRTEEANALRARISET